MTTAAPTLLFSVCTIFLGGNARGQTFEVASVKPSAPDVRGTNVHMPNGTFNATGMTAKNCIGLAYDVQPFQLEGGPSWIGDQRYDVVAKLPAGTVNGPQDPERMNRMRAALQALLADRFQLAIHRETKLVPAYALVLAKSGFKLKETADDGRGVDISSNRGKLVAQRISMATLARNLSGNMGSPVMDMTGINGIFDLTLEWTPDEVRSPAKPGTEAAEPSLGPSIFDALQEQLGLKLEKQKAPVEMIVIDRIEKPGGN
jgi:uncharacterized protein (TIGR03435 family)